MPFYFVGKTVNYAHETTWIELSKSALEYNIAQYRNIIGPTCMLAPVIKSNAYGHGLALLAKFYQKIEAVNWLCTVNVSEAGAVREAGWRKPLLVLGYVDVPLPEALELNIDLPIYDLQFVQQLNETARAHNTVAHVHIKVDTGMTRLGIAPEEVIALIQKIQHLPCIRIRGIFSHLACASNPEHPANKEQCASFTRMQEQLKLAGIQIPYHHLSSTAAATSIYVPQQNFVRIGRGMYGIWSSHEHKEHARKHFPNFSLQPALSWKCKIIQIKRVPAGAAVGYAATFTATRPSIIGILPVGYHEGYRRTLSSNSFVWVNGALAPVVGVVSMNLMAIDLTDVPGVTTETPVTLLGNHASVRLEDLALRAGTIPIEFTTLLNRTVSRSLVA